MSVPQALLIVALEMGLLGALAVYVYLSVSKTTPVGILRGLRECPTGYVVRLRGTQGAWKPDGQPFDREVIGPGIATYTLETATDGVVSIRLDWKPIGAPPRQMTGVVPERLNQLADYKRLGKLRVTPPLVFKSQVFLAPIGVLAALGFTYGWAESERATAVILGAVCGLVAPLLIFPIALKVGRLREGQGPGSAPPHPPLVRLVLALPVLFASGGSVLGWLLTEGEPDGVRGWSTAGGFVAGLFLVWLLLLTGLIGDAVRKTIRHEGEHQTTDTS